MLSCSRTYQTNLRLGVALMAAAMLVVPAVDALAKNLSNEHSPLFVAWARYAAASVFVLPVAAAQYGKKMFPRHDIAAHVLRTVLIVGSMTLYFLAISTTPLASAVSVYFIGPIAAAGLAVIFLGERLSAKKAISLVLGAAGAMATLGPWTAHGSGIWLALGAGLTFAVYLLLTRRATRGSQALPTLVFQCLLGAVLLAPQAILTWSTPGWKEVPLFLLMGALSAAAHGLMISAFRYADATTLAPLVYLELAGAVALGFLFFGEVPGSGTLFGAGLIVCAGLCLTGLEPDPAPTHIEKPGERLGHPRNTSSSKG